MIFADTLHSQRKSKKSRPSPQLNRLALWGNVGCGKDTWAATLPFAVEKAGLSMSPFDEATAEWQAETRLRMATGDFPRATDLPKSANELKLLTFEILDNSPTVPILQRQRFLVQIPQAAGGWWTDPQKSRRLHVNSPDPYEFLLHCSGVICLLDPTAADHKDAAISLMTMLDYLNVYRRRLKQRRRIRVALWLTKMDHPQHRSYRGYEKEYAQLLFGERFFNFLKAYSGSGGYEFKWGGCSAIGTVLHEGRVRSNSYVDYSTVDRNGHPLPVSRILAPKSIQPDGVAEPMRWVMEPLLTGAFNPRTLFGGGFWL